MSSHTLSEVHYINNPTPVFSSHFNLVLSLPVISPAVSFLPSACSHSHCAPLSVNKQPCPSFPYPSVYQPVSWGAAAMSQRWDRSHGTALWRWVGLKPRAHLTGPLLSASLRGHQCPLRQANKKQQQSHCDTQQSSHAKEHYWLLLLDVWLSQWTPASSSVWWD